MRHIASVARALLIAAPCLYLACKNNDSSTSTANTEPTVDDAGLGQPPPTIDEAGATEEGAAGDPQACAVNPLGAEAVDGATLQVLAQAPFPDGPHWDEASGQLVISEVNAQQIVRIGAGANRTMIRWAGDGNLPIGNAVAGGYIFTAQASLNGTGAILKTKLDGTAPETLATPGVNSPNDIVASSKGFLYFTDPGFQAVVAAPSTGIYRMSTNGGDIAVVEKFAAVETNPGARVDGIALSADEKTLYVGFFDERRLMKYAIDDSGMPIKSDAVPFRPADHPTGIAVDTVGNLWIAESSEEGMHGRVEVIAADGKKWGEIAFGDSRPTGVAFGAADGRTVYITTERDTAAGTVYSTTTPCAGVR